MAYQKIGFHVGPAGNREGIGAYFEALAAAGLPSVLMSADDPGVIAEAQGIADAHDAPAVLAFRWTAQGSGMPETPNYDATPAVAAEVHWDSYGDWLSTTPEIDGRVWVVPLNEVDKARADWLGWFCLELAQRANAEGYRVALPAWSAGEPEPEHWETPGMLAYLEYCAAHPEQAAVALHEYSLSPDIQNITPWLIGRFQFLFDVCDEHGIDRPRVLITEWGWEYEDVGGIDDVRWAADLYAQHPQILGAMVWYLGGGYDNIANQAQQLIAPVTDFSLESQWTPPADEPAPPTEEPMNALGIDVSRWQGDVDWQKARDAGADFAYIRATMGSAGVDSFFDVNYRGAGEAGILRGVYHLFRFDSDWWKQAYHFSQYVPDDSELPPAVDLELEPDTQQWLRKRIIYFLHLVEALTGKRPIVYTSPGWWGEHIAGEWNNEDWDQFDLWIAHWEADAPAVPGDWPDWTFWQYTSDGDGARFGASSGRVDLNRFNGTFEELQQVYGLAEPAPEPDERQGYLNRDWNLRRWPELGADSLMLTAHAGMPVTVIGDVEGEEYDGSTKWYELRTLAHSAGVDLDGEPEPEPPGEQTGVTFPVGTAEERAAAVDGWPGDWFNANPYGNYYHVRDGHYAYHTGADLNLNQPTWDSDRGKPVVAVASGVVTYAERFNSSWGNIIVIDHGGFYSRYSAVDELQVAAGDTVAAGQQIAVVGQHGEGEPFHLHFDISTTERLAENPGDWPGTDRARLERDYVPPLPFILARLDPGIDLLPYFLGRDGQSIELHYTWGPGTHPLQVQHGDDGVFWYVKGDNGESEELWSSDQYIYRGVDFSEAHDRYYVQYTPLPDRLAYGARWCPRFMRVGETAEFAPYVIHYWQADCSERGPQGQPLNRISLLAHHDSYTFPSGITLDGVIELGWEGQERYFFSRQYGLCGWKGEGVGQSYISQVHESRPLVRQVPGCWEAPERYRG